MILTAVARGFSHTSLHFTALVHVQSECLNLLFSTVHETASDRVPDEGFVTAGSVDAIVWGAVAVLL